MKVHAVPNQAVRVSCETECERTDVRLARQSAGELEASEEATLAAHLEACEVCREVALALPSGAAPVFPTVDEAAYELGPVVGVGGMGRISIARDRRIGRVVALKELLFDTPDCVARFVREARIAAALQHPNIVPIYDIGCWADGTPFYTMRLVEGGTLFEALRTADSLEARMKLLPSVIAAADAVAFAHANQVVHRDLTPANVLIGSYGETIVIDWGLAKDLHVSRARVATRYQTGTTQQVLTGRGAVVGSPAYMPPEQAAGQPVDTTADVYALGAILYHLVAGKPPYNGRTAGEILAKVSAAPPPSLARAAKHVPPALARIVDTAMAREPSQRYATAAEVAHDLRELQTRLFVEAHRRPRWFPWSRS